MFAAMIASLLGDSKPARAQMITRSVPEVDRVSIRVVIDSYQFAVAPGKKVGSVEVQHFGWGLNGDKPPDRTLISEFGLSMHAESKLGRETRNLLMDFGFTPQALNNNASLLAVDPSELDALVLSHGPGIPEALREEAFRPFNRLEKSRNRETGGSGLGLTVARTLARAHGGDVLLNEAPGGGLRATVVLPHMLALHKQSAAE